MTVTILFLLFYIIVPMGIIIYGIVHLFRLRKRAVSRVLRVQPSVTQLSLSQLESQSDAFDILILNLPNHFRENKMLAMNELAKICDETDRKVLTRKSLASLQFALKIVRLGWSKSYRTFLQSSSVSEHLADILDKVNEALAQKDNDYYFVGISNLIRLSLLHDEYTGWEPIEHGEHEMSRQDKIVLNQIIKMSDLMVLVARQEDKFRRNLLEREYEFQRNLLRFQIEENWKIFSVDIIFALTYLAQRLGNARNSDSLPPVDEWSALIRDRSNASQLTHDIYSGLMERRYDSVVLHIENDLKSIILQEDEVDIEKALETPMLETIETEVSSTSR